MYTVNVGDYHDTSISEYEEPEDLDFHPTQRRTRPTFVPAPSWTRYPDPGLCGIPGLVTNNRPDSTHFSDANVRYLQSPPIQAAEFMHLFRRLRVMADPRNHGWSCYPGTHGTRGGSWTWFWITLGDGETGNEIKVVRSIHARPRYVKGLLWG